MSLTEYSCVRVLPVLAAPMYCVPARRVNGPCLRGIMFCMCRPAERYFSWSIRASSLGLNSPDEKLTWLSIVLPI